MITNANFSRCRTYRYALWRTWDTSQPFVLIIGLNPSKADEQNNDPTITRCINFAKEWSFGGLCMANLFAYCATYPKDLKNAEDPIGRANDRWLSRLDKDAGLSVAAWGNDGRFMGRSTQVQKRLTNLHCIRVNRSGEPAHPLYLKSGLLPLRLN